jgi:prevent-host-death family protein
MERRMNATEARIRFGELMRWVVESREPVIVERQGRPHVVVLSVDTYERLLAGRHEREDWRELSTRPGSRFEPNWASIHCHHRRR